MTEDRYGAPPYYLDAFREVELLEFMSWLYLPIKMRGDSRIELPANAEPVRPLVDRVLADLADSDTVLDDQYLYLTAKCGFATPDNPLNRPGWHCDGFGTDDLNYIWWSGAGTRFLITGFGLDGIGKDHHRSMDRFEELAARYPQHVSTPDSRVLYRLSPFVIHTTPDIEPPGEPRSWVKISVSPHRYNLMGNAHNYAFDYQWRMWPRDVMRNDPARALADSYDPEPTR